MRTKKLRPRRYALRRVPLVTLNILKQPRRTFDGLEELAADILEKGGMLMAPIVAEFDCQEVLVRYLDAVNTVYGTSYAVADLTPCAHTGQYYVLLAGERRTRAYRLLVESERAEPWYWADVRTNINPVVALEIQLSENTHRAVPPHEEADAIERLYRFERSRGPVTLVAFARRVGRSEQWVRNALRFCELPDVVQDLVRSRHLSFGAALELAKLMRAGYDSAQVHDWALTALVSRLTLEELRERVQHRLAELTDGQASLLGIMEGEQQRAERANARRRTVAAQTVRALSESEAYLLLVLRLLSSGQLGTDESPYALGSPRRHAHKNVLVLLHVAAHLLQQRGCVPLEVETALSCVERVLRE